MSNLAIRAQGLGKRYWIGALSHQMSMRERLTHAMMAPTRWIGANRNGASTKPREFWALRDVSFDLERGEVLGLIGRNGAGKSTLLKVLARVTQPTTGEATIHGRVGSLLEVGTGFHLELTGRENVYLNGAILGMGKREIDRKFDEIVAFAEVADFIDTPLKHYSSGMQMRLAFAVAAHLEPEILLVDEVLAVGDLAFQKKCMGKMGEVANDGRTIVFVSHQVNQIRRLCKKVIWMDKGAVFRVGSTAQIVGDYEASVLHRTENSRVAADAPEITCGFTNWEIVEPRAETSNLLDTLGPVHLKFVLRLDRPIHYGTHGLALYNHERQLIWAWGTKNLTLSVGTHEFHYRFPTLPLRPGLYNWLVSLYEHEREIDMWSCVPEMVIATEINQHPYDHWNGILNVPCEFDVRQAKNQLIVNAASGRENQGLG